MKGGKRGHTSAAWSAGPIPRPYEFQDLLAVTDITIACGKPNKPYSVMCLMNPSHRVIPGMTE